MIAHQIIKSADGCGISLSLLGPRLTRELPSAASAELHSLSGSRSPCCVLSIIRFAIMSRIRSGTCCGCQFALQQTVGPTDA